MHQLLNEELVLRLQDIAGSKADEYQLAQPFPHIAIDDLLPAAPLRQALSEFPDPNQLKWLKYENPDEKKLAFNQVEKLPDSLREILYFLNSSVILQFLETLTGIHGLVADPYFVGGGLHQIQPGGYLEVHADFNRHEKLRLDRRLNLLLYLNQEWEEEYGGHLELWDHSMTTCVRKVLPVFNRCVVFSTTDIAFHGHPTPLACPPGQSRKSIATYYYTNGRPEEEQGADHSTLFQHRPGANHRGRKAVYTAKRVLRAILPPIITDGIHSLKNR